MDAIFGILSWIKTNSGELAILVTSIIGTATLIVKLTPSPADDKVLAKIKKFLSKYIALNE